ncbi:MAG: histidine--tRNA ligase [Actinomycetota bacterium]
MELKPPRGTQDFVPPEGSRLRALYDRAADVARRFGYRYVETPTFEHTELFARTSGQTSDVVSKEMYTFVDRGGRSLTLRPEGTAPVVRAFLEHRHDLPSPFKAYYLTRMFRYGRPQSGRYREHRQFGVEAIDAAEPAADVEVITLGDAYLRSLGLARYELQINSLGDDVCRPAYRALLVEYLRANRERLRDEHRDRFAENPMRVLDCKDEACRAVAADAPQMIDHLCDPCRAHFDGVLEGLRAEGLKPQVVPTVVRGLDYYTRTAFEFVSEVLSDAQATLFGGGRYDGLAEALGGPHVPGVGFGMGIERVLLALRDEGIEPPHEPDLDVFVVGVGQSGRSAASDLLRLLRGAGVSAAASFGERPLKAQLKMADRTGARFAAIVGDAEAEAGTVTLKHLADGTQQTVGAAEVVERVRGRA